MRTVVHSSNYLWRYLACFLASIILYLSYAPALAWPVRAAYGFLICAFALAFHPNGRLCCGYTSASFGRRVIQLHTIWLWQGLAALTAIALQCVLLNLFAPDLAAPHHWAGSLWFYLSLAATLLIATTITAALSCSVYRRRRPLTLAPLFPGQANGETRLMIFGNTWLRDASVATGMIAYSASILLGVKLCGIKISPLAIDGALILSFFAIRQPWLRHSLQRVNKRYGFAWVLILTTILFFLCLLPVYALLPASATLIDQQPLSAIDSATLWQSLSLLVVAPLLFRTAPLCQGLSLRTAIVGAAVNPYFIVIALSNSWRPWLARALTALNTSSIALTCLAAGLTLASLAYLGSTWFANVLERLFSNEQSQYPSRMRWFFGRRLQLHLLVWLFIISLGLAKVALVFIATVAGGSLLAYFHYYFFFWQRARDFMVSHARKL